ncbi:hypothetical protein, partial [Pediococcus parvulus]|uniref:hypothetical protein n=1 Tax=Pediococcus parvulus TaxID=54062 RepID=UPI002954B6F1
MKRSVVLSIALGSLILIMSLGTNAYQHSQVKQAQQQISRLQQQKRQVSQQLTKANQQKQLLSTQIDSYKTYQNNKDKSQAELSFNTVVTKFFKVMNNFKPKTYGQRKNGVKDLISDKLYQQYFSNKGTYGDSNSVSAKLNQLNLYTQSKQGQNMGSTIFGTDRCSLREHILVTFLYTDKKREDSLHLSFPERNYLS